MLVTGLYFYYRAEQAQIKGDLVLGEQVALQGQYKGMSEVKSLSESRYFFWLDHGETSRGARIDAAQWAALKGLNPALQQGEQLQVVAAPRVAGSTTVWVIAIERGGESIPEAAPAN